MPDIIELLGIRARLIDLSRTLEPTPSEPTPPRIRRISHQECAEMWKELFGIPASVLPVQSGFAGEIVEASTHAGTHVDAPWHYASTSEGEPASTVDELPLSWFIGQAAVIDVAELPTGHLITPHEIESRLKQLNHSITAGEIILFRTGADAVWGTEEYFRYGCGLGEEAVLYLNDHGVRVIGTDAWSLDRPYPLIGEEWATCHDPKRLWPAHFAGIKRRYSQIEKLTNLDKLPPLGATVMCFPIKIDSASGAWSRVVGLVPAEHG